MFKMPTFCYNINHILSIKLISLSCRKIPNIKLLKLFDSVQKFDLSKV